MFSQLDQAVFFMPCLSARGPVGLARRTIAMVSFSISDACTAGSRLWARRE